MPLSVIVQEVQQQLVSLGILAIIVLLTGEPITWLWLGVVPVVLMQTVFNVGLCMLVARWTAASRDVAQLVPFVMQTWRYLSGVMFSIPIFTADLEPWVEKVLYLNPMTEYIELMRACLLQGYEVPGSLWAFAAGWAVVTLVVGFVVFYRAEETYSRG
jgi:teichoic acid transport system permease protein